MTTRSRIAGRRPRGVRTPTRGRRSLVSWGDAARLLGVTVEDLRGYVSRGILEEQRGSGGRSRGFARTAVEAAREALADPLAKYCGAIDLGAPDVAERHDAYLANTVEASRPPTDRR